MGGDNSVSMDKVREVSESYKYYTNLREERRDLIKELDMLELMVETNYGRLRLDNKVEVTKKPSGEIIEFVVVLENEGILKSEIDRLNKDITQLEKVRVGLRKERDRLADKVTNIITKDGLTGLYNKEEGEKRLEEEIKRAERDGKYFALVMIDLDRFKTYNDTYGHLQGNKALETIGYAIGTRTRSTDSTHRLEGNYDRDSFRYGGEEFMVILTGIDEESAANVVEKLRKAIEESEIPVGEIKKQKEGSKSPYSFMTGLGPNKVTASIGYVIYGIDEPFREEENRKNEGLLKNKAEKLILMADKALYDSKDTRNSITRSVQNEQAHPEA